MARWQLGEWMAFFRAEGVAGMRRRFAARRNDTRRRASYLKCELDALARAVAPVPVLNLLPFSPEPRFGGAAIALAQRLEEEARQRPVALLYANGARWRLEARRGEERRVWSTADAPPPAPDRLEAPELGELLARVQSALGAGLLHVENLGGLPVATLERLAGERPLFLSTHDFAHFCARPNLLEEPEGTFCGFSTSPARCARCLAVDFGVDAAFQERRRKSAAELARRAVALVHSSDFARRETARTVPELDPSRQVIVPPAVRRLGGSPGREPLWPPRRVAFVGQAHRHKGILEFEALVQALPTPTSGIAWAVAGSGDGRVLLRLRRLGVELLGAYAPGGLPELLSRARVDLALLLSRFPETHSLALDECLIAGVPVIAAPVGALAARIPTSGAGWVAEPGPIAAAVARALEALRADPTAGGRRRADRSVVSTPAEAAAAHLALYARKGFASDRAARP